MYGLVSRAFAERVLPCCSDLDPDESSSYARARTAIIIMIIVMGYIHWELLPKVWC